eukprot:TRINITY_DN4173_c2_g4_i1.p1 TRINITY_DN4173_c2_g4~~TRINITY_DN4173_c2_g4_i1.p1  ORF type:complete len:317 (+),score=39.47 TRINITY_DN4173_c2_g4_i1:48-998(+)
MVSTVETLEWRIDAADGCAYTLQDFILEYGGTDDTPPQQWLVAPRASQEAIERSLQDNAEGDCDAHDDNGSDMDDDEESSDDEVMSSNAPAWVPVFDMAGEPAEVLDGMMDAMRHFGVTVKESDVGPTNFAVPPGSALATLLLAIRKQLFAGDANRAALVRGVPWPREPTLQRILLLAIGVGLRLRAVPLSNDANDLVRESSITANGAEPIGPASDVQAILYVRHGRKRGVQSQAVASGELPDAESSPPGLPSVNVLHEGNVHTFELNKGDLLLLHSCKRTKEHGVLRQNGKQTSEQTSTGNDTESAKLLQLWLKQ